MRSDKEHVPEYVLNPKRFKHDDQQSQLCVSADVNSFIDSWSSFNLHFHRFCQNSLLIRFTALNWKSLKNQLLLWSVCSAAAGCHDNNNMLIELQWRTDAMIFSHAWKLWISFRTIRNHETKKIFCHMSITAMWELKDGPGPQQNFSTTARAAHGVPLEN